MKFNYLLLLVLVLTITSVSAWPYEMYSNGTIVDLNSSNSQTTILTINYYNITNVTNVTNVTSVTNNLNGSFYNKTEADSRFLRQGEQYGNTEVFNRADLNIILNKLNATDVNHTAQLDDINDTNTNGWLWATVILALLLAAIALVLIGKDGGGYGN